MKKEYSNSTFIVYDTWSFFTQVLDRPDKFDIKYTQKYCPDWKVKSHTKTNNSYAHAHLSKGQHQRNITVNQCNSKKERKKRIHV